MEQRFFDTVNIQLPVNKVYARLGYAAGYTDISSDQKQMVNDYVNKARALLKLQGSACRMKAAFSAVGDIIMEEGVIFKSVALRNNLKGACELLLVGVTAGSEIYDFIKRNSANGDATAAIIYDAVASEAVDEGLGWIADFYANSIRCEGKIVMPIRFSCGYSDFHLSNQKVIYEKLQLAHFGVELTTSYILKPEKSVTALIGIKNI